MASDETGVRYISLVSESNMLNAAYLEQPSRLPVLLVGVLVALVMI